MPLHDFGCTLCGHFEVDVYRSIDVGAQGDPPFCCGQPMTWIPQVSRMDVWEPFEVKDGRNHSVLVDSLKKLREVETESLKMAADGVGQPMVWRKYSQDHSQTHDHTLKADPSQAPDPAFLRRLKLARHGGEEPNRAYGPSVSAANTSALKD